MAVEDTIKSRDNQYGDYAVQSRVAQKLKHEMQADNRLSDLPADMRESLEMIATKISRILCGNCNNVDNWHDIAGYATLIEYRLRKANVESK